MNEQRPWQRQPHGDGCNSINETVKNHLFNFFSRMMTITATLIMGTTTTTTTTINHDVILQLQRQTMPPMATTARNMNE
jgi:hypothetical protein